MPMHAHEIEELILKAFPDAEVTIEDLRGDGDHYSCKVISSAFAGKKPRSATSDGISVSGRPHGRCVTRACASDKSTRIIFEQHSHIRQNNKESSHG